MRSNAEYKAAMDRYIDAVMTGKRPANKYEKAAVQRHIDNHHKDTLRWDEEAAFRKLRIIEMLPHVKGRWENPLLVMEDWQVFIIADMMGWISVETGYRTYRQAYLLIARKNAKTTMGAGLMLALGIADDEPGPEVYSAARVKEQAAVSWTIAAKMIKRLPDLQVAKEIEIPSGNLDKCSRKDITFGCNDGFFRPLSSDDKSLDGLSPSAALLDELHAHRTPDVYDVILSGTGARKQAFVLCITTAGTDLASIGYKEYMYVRDLLDGKFEDDNYWGMIYAPDEGDDPLSSEAIHKANPNLGVSIQEHDILAEAKKAENDPAYMANFKTKHLNLWQNAGNAWRNIEVWQRMETAKLDSLKGNKAWLSFDLANQLDICAVGITVKVGTKYFYDSFSFVPRGSLEQKGGEAKIRYWKQYLGWESKGEMTVVDGEAVEHQHVLNKMYELAKMFRVQEVLYDGWYGTQLALSLKSAGIKALAIPQQTRNLSPLMRRIEAAEAQGRIMHSGNDCMLWQLSNVVVHEDANGNIFPRKERPEQKIDAALTLIMSMGRALEMENKRSTFTLHVGGNNGSKNTANAST